MYFLIALLMANICLLAAYNGAPEIDAQDREFPVDIRLKRVVIPPKWRWMFRFRWSYSGDVLFIALVVEITGLIFAFLLVCLGIVFTIFSFAYALHIIFGTFLLYGFLLLVYSFIGVIQYEIKKSRKRKYHKAEPFEKKCWRLEIKKAISVKVCELPEAKVRVLDIQTTRDGRQIYVIQYGRWIVRDFYAVANKKYKPVSGTYAKAIYTNTSPHFILLSDWRDE